MLAYACRRSTRFATFPDYLTVQMKKFTLGDDWIPKKLGMFKIVFTKLNKNTELARALDVTMARAKIFGFS